MTNNRTTDKQKASGNGDSPFTGGALKKYAEGH